VIATARMWYRISGCTEPLKTDPVWSVLLLRTRYKASVFTVLFVYGAILALFIQLVLRSECNSVFIRKRGA